MDSRIVAIEAPGAPDPAREPAYREALETGQILFFPRTPFELPEADQSFLRDQRQVGARLPQEHRLPAGVRPGERLRAPATRGRGDHPAGPP